MVRSHSRSIRLIRFRTTAFPTFFVTVMPTRPTGKACCSASARRWRPCSFLPPDWTAMNSARRRSRISLLMRQPATPSTSWRSSPRCACGPWRAGGEEPRGLRGSSCGLGSRGCACGSCYAADTYASRFDLPERSGVCGARSIRNRGGGVKDACPEFNCRRNWLAIANAHLLPTPKFLLWTTPEEWYGRGSRSGCG